MKDKYPLNARDRKLIALQSAVNRGDGRVMRIVGLVFLFTACLAGWFTWQDFHKRGFEWGTVAFTVFMALFGMLLVFGAKTQKQTRGIFQHILQSGEKLVVTGNLQHVELNALGGLTYQMEEGVYSVSIPFVLPYVFIPQLDKAQILQTGEPITLHLVELEPGRYLRLHVDYGDRVEKKEIVGNSTFMPQDTKYSIFATVLVSVIAGGLWVMLEFIMHGTEGAWFAKPEISWMCFAFTVAPALIALNAFVRAKRRYKVLTVIKGRLSEVLEAHARSGKLRLPHNWYTVGGEVLQVGASDPLSVGAMVEARYLTTIDGQFPLPVSIKLITD